MPQLIVLNRSMFVHQQIWGTQLFWSNSSDILENDAALTPTSTTKKKGVVRQK